MENWNVEYNKIIYHILQITVCYKIASNLNHFQNIYSHYILHNEIIKICFPQTTQVSKLESIFSKLPSKLQFGFEHLLGGTARAVLFIRGHMSSQN